MPRSLPRNWRNAPRGDHETTCSICGVAWQRSKLVRKADGLLYCPDDRGGRDAVTLSRLNAARIPRLHHVPQDGGGFDSRSYEPIGHASFALEFIIGEDGMMLVGEDGSFLVSEGSNV